MDFNTLLSFGLDNVWCRPKTGQLKYCLVFTIITKCLNLFLLNRHQTARAWCLPVPPFTIYAFHLFQQTINKIKKTHKTIL